MASHNNNDLITREQLTQAIATMSRTLQQQIQDAHLADPTDPTDYVTNGQMVIYVTNAMNALQRQFLDLLGYAIDEIDTINGEVI